MHMTHRVMAADAGEILPLMIEVDFVHNLLMTIPAGFFRNAVIPFGDLNRFMKITCGKRPGMVETIECLGEVFINQRVRGVAIIAGGDVLMAGLHPAVILLIHDMTIGAGGRIVSQVRGALCVNKCVAADSSGYAYRNTNNDCSEEKGFHR